MTIWEGQRSEIRGYWQADRPFDSIKDGFDRLSALAMLAEIDRLEARELELEAAQKERDLARVRGDELRAIVVELARLSRVAVRNGDLHARSASALALWEEQMENTTP